MHAIGVVLKNVVQRERGFFGVWNVYRVCEWGKEIRIQLMNFFKNP